MQHAHVISWNHVDSDPASNENPDSSLFDRRILAEGDSWFSLGGIPTSNLLFAMKFQASTIIVNCGSPGDTITNMARMASNPELRRAMSSAFGYNWDAILLSGGGNDVIDKADEIIQSAPGNPTDPAAYCNQTELDNVLREVTDGYRSIVALRDRSDSVCQNKPIVIHTYDLVTPRNAPARFVGVPLLGPWFYPALGSAAVSTDRWNEVSDYVLGRLAEALKGLASGPNKLPNFFTVSTQRTLQRAEPGTTLESGDWMNEIHPSGDGYKRLATKISAKLRQLI